jgi:hypothetical protein
MRQSDAGDWGSYAPYPDDDTRSGGLTTSIGLILLLALAVICVAAYLLFRILTGGSPAAALPVAANTQTLLPGSSTTVPVSSPTPEPSGEPGQAVMSINPEQGYINTLITITGQGWWPGEPVFVFLRSEAEGDGQGYSYAAAVADDWGNFRTAFTFPNETRWLGQPWADVIARGTRSGLEAITRLTLVGPTATPTRIPPTAAPTSAYTSTPPPTSTPAPTSTLHPTSTPAITDWRGEYYANMTLSGSPAVVRNDVAVRFDWGQGSPAAGVPADAFSVRWSRSLHFRRGLYRFSVGADDGARFWVDGRLLVDEWHDTPYTVYSFDLYLYRGDHPLLLEYYENIDQARVDLAWERIDTSTSTPTMTPQPASSPTLTPSPTNTPFLPPLPTEWPTPLPLPTLPPLPTIRVKPAWIGEFYANPTLSGDPVLMRKDTYLSFDWGPGAPHQAVPADHFSARWTRDRWLDAGTYRIFADVDDSVRVWIDGLLLMDEWDTDGGGTYTAEVTLRAGMHSLRVEYCEEARDARLRFSIKELPHDADDPRPGIPRLTRTPEPEDQPRRRLCICWNGFCIFPESCYNPPP